MSSSKKKKKNNKSHVDNINQINEEEDNANEDSFESINQYTIKIMKNSECIKKLENQVNKLEKNILEIINQLEKDDKKKKKSKKDKKKLNKKEENVVKKNEEDKNAFNSNPHDISNIGDVSITVPRIIYRDLSITKDDM